MKIKRTKHFIILLSVICVISCKHNTQNDYSKYGEELSLLFSEVEKSPNNPEVYINRANYYIKNRKTEGFLDSAFVDSYKALRLDSLNPQRYIFLSDLFFMEGLFENCEEILESAYTKIPKSIDVMMKLAELHLLYQRYSEMNEILNNALEIDSRNPVAYFMRGFALKEQGDTLNAIRNFNKAVEQNPQYFDAYIELGLMYHARHNPLALDYYNNALNINPQSIEALYDKALFYQETNEIQKAKETYQMLIQFDERSAWAYHNLGWIALEKDHDYEEAVKQFNFALNIEPNFVEALYNRGAAYERMGKKQQAIESYNNAVKINGEFTLAIDRLKYLKAI